MALHWSAAHFLLALALSLGFSLWWGVKTPRFSIARGACVAAMAVGGSWAAVFLAELATARL